MFSLIRADLRRILRKKSFLILLVYLAFTEFTHALSNSELPVEEFTSGIRGHLDGLVMLFITILIYMGVYADDQRSRSIVTLIGRGMRREEVFSAKLIVSILCSSLLFVITMMFLQFDISLMSIPVTPRQKSLLWMYVLFLIVRSAGCLALSMLALYLTDSAAVGIIVDVFAVILVQLGLQIAKLLLGYDLSIYSLSGLVEAGFGNAAVGRAPWQLVPAILIYIAAPVWAAAVLNQKKEMEL